MAYRIEMDIGQVLTKRGLNQNGTAQALFTKTCEKEMNDFVPFLTGDLKDVKVETNIDNITYTAPYAARQYYTNRGMGKEGINLGGLRGMAWDKRMWPQRKDEILKTIAGFVGGEVK